MNRTENSLVPPMSKYLMKMVSREIEGSKPVIDLIAGSTNQRDLGTFIDDTIKDMCTRYLRHRQGKVESIKPELLAKYEAELKEAGDQYRSEVMEYYCIMRRDREVALIEYPLLSHLVAEAMAAKGIPYRFLTRRYENILTVQVVGEWFFDIPVTLDSLQKIMDLLGYCLMRPDHAKKTLPQIRKRVDYNLARSWKEVAESGSV